VITDATGIPLAATVTGGNRHDVTQLIPLPTATAARSLPDRSVRNVQAWWLAALRRDRKLFAHWAWMPHFWLAG